MQQKFCPNCGTPLKPGTAFCASCGAPTAPQATVQYAGATKKPGNNKLILTIAIICVVAILGVAVFFVVSHFRNTGGVSSVRSSDSGKKERSDGGSVQPGNRNMQEEAEDNEPSSTADLKTVLYIKDNEIYSSPVGEAAPVQITERLSKDEELTESIGGIGAYLTPIINADETKYVYIDKLKASSDGVDLYFRNPKNLKKEPTEIASDVKMFTGNKDLTALVYIKGDKNKLCFYDFKTETELESKEIEYFATDENVSTLIYYNTDYDLMIRSGKNFSVQEEIASKIDTNGSFRINAKNGAVTGIWYRKKDNLYYYEISKKESVKIDSDVASYYPIGSGGELYYTVPNDDGTYTLYYVAKLGDIGEEVSDSASYVITRSTDNAVVIFQEKNSSPNRGDTYSYVAAIGAESVFDFEEDDLSFSISKDGTAIYYLSECDEADQIGELIKLPVSGGKLGKAETLADEVYEYFFAQDNKTIYYFEDSYNEDLFVVGQSKAVVSDVYSYSLSGDGAGLLLMTEWDDEDGGRLIRYDGKTATLIASDVHAYIDLGPKKIVYLKEYDDKYGEGELYIYNGSKTPLQIDSDVTSLLPVRKQGVYIAVWYG